VDALRSGHLSGAALDVFSVEPPAPSHPLLALETVIATPHVGGNTVDVAGHQGRIIAADLERLLRGDRPRHVLNPAVLDAFDWSRPRPRVDATRIEALAARSRPAVTDLQLTGGRRAVAGATTAVNGDAPTVAASSTAAAVPRELRNHMEHLLHAFVTGFQGDAALRALGADKDVTLHFVLSDLDLACWLRLHAGTLVGGVGQPDPAADVQLKMGAEVFDGVFTGATNPMQAAMDGRLSFSGDTVKAMTLAELQDDLCRVYRQSRQTVGDPGDLGSLAPSSSDGTTARPVRPGDLRLNLVEIVDELYAKQVVTATGGNVSARIPGTTEVWITPSQFFKGGLRPEMLVRIGLDGEARDADALSPSSERLMHCAAYAARAEVGAVVHAHAPHATILANAGLPFLPISTEAAFFGNIPRVPFIMPGTRELAEAVGEALRESWAVLMQNHGLLVAGRSLRRAADGVEIIERSAEIILGCYAVGKEPPVLPDAVVARLRKMGDLVA
jgi:autoinducer 2 (AI-2) kinase